MDRIRVAPRTSWLPEWGLSAKTILAFWTFYFALATTRMFLLDQPGQIEITRRRIAVVLVAIALSALVAVGLRWTATASIRTRIFVAAVLCLPAAMMLAATSHYMFYVYSPLEAVWAGPRLPDTRGWSATKILAEGTHSSYFFFASWAAIYVALSYARQLRVADTRAAALAREAQDAQLRALRYQINPHFLFNTLNSLSSLVLAKRTETAEQMLMNLSSFFRTTLTADPTADVPLSEEIALQRLYLEIEQVRFPERLKVEIDVPERLLSRRVPVLILQPIVENSVKYGVARARSPVTIRIQAHEEAGRLHIKVADDGEPLGCGDGLDGTGVGLANVCERLSARFGAAAGCLHGPDPEGGYRVHIFMPAVSDG
jgi:hypothetical protein